MKLKIRVIGFDKDPVKFLRNLLYPLDGYEVVVVDESIIIKPKDNRVKGQIYGRERTNFMWIKEIFIKYFKEFELSME